MVVDPEGSDKSKQEEVNRILTIILIIVAVMVVIFSGLIFLILQYLDELKVKKSMKMSMSKRIN
jgi:heme/copper-type cytochrome/quinol oxidase subunit 2